MSAHNQLQEHLIADPVLVDPGTGRTVQIDRHDAYLNLRSGASNETRILGAPTRAGQTLTIGLAVDGGGDVAVTQTGSAAFNASGNTTITLNDTGDNVTLVSIAIATALRWRLKSNDGATLS